MARNLESMDSAISQSCERSAATTVAITAGQTTGELAPSFIIRLLI